MELCEADKVKEAIVSRELQCKNGSAFWWPIWWQELLAVKDSGAGCYNKWKGVDHIDEEFATWTLERDGMFVFVL